MTPRRRTTDRPSQMMRAWWRLAFTVGASAALIWLMLFLIGRHL
jgi:demethoxyubiquinone hydroxylase (CLK1/Coq7/Cat5 family)